jgi:cysteine synthase A
MMAALGAEVVLVPQAPGSSRGQVSGEDLALVERETQRSSGRRGAFRADQFHHTGNYRAHYLHTGPEILRQAGRPADAFCDFVGTGGSFGGCAAALKEADPATRCFVVEPVGAAALSGQPVARAHHRIQGGGYSMPELDFVRPGAVDGYIQVTMRKRSGGAATRSTEGLFLLLVRGERRRRCNSTALPGQTVVTLLNDRLKYQHRPLGITGAICALCALWIQFRNCKRTSPIV